MLVGSGERHLGFVQQQDSASGSLEVSRNIESMTWPWLAVAGIHHFRLIFEEIQLGARIVLFGVEEVGFAGLDVAGLETVDVAIHFSPRRA